MIIFALLKFTALIQLHDLKFEPFISEEEIKEGIKKITEAVNKDYQDKTPVFLGILNGAFMVASEIIKGFEGDCEVAFTKLASYRGTASRGEVETLIGLEMSLEGREVIVIEDIVDTGNTLEAIDRMLKGKRVKNYRIASLFLKPEAYKKKYPVHYVGFKIPNDFIVGYGLDYDGLGRNLSQVYKLKK